MLIKNLFLFLYFRFIGGRVHWGVFIALLGSFVSLVLFQLTSKWGWLFNVSFMLLAGICNCGPDAFVSGSLAAEIGDRESAQSAVSGFINGELIILTAICNSKGDRPAKAQLRFQMSIPL